MRKAIVMAGGQGTRRWPLTATQPKSLVSIVNRPVMPHILEWLREHGVSEIRATLHYRADDIRRTFGTSHSLGVRLTYRVESCVLQWVPRGQAFDWRRDAFPRLLL